MTATGAARAPFVGRGRELAELREWLGEAGAGAGRLVLLAGPAGMGKSRLAEELAVAARDDDIPVLWGRCTDDAGGPPLWVWQRALRALPDGGFGSGPAPAGIDEGAARAEDLAAARFRIAMATGDTLAAAAEPGGALVVLDDLHWADEASVQLLRLVAGELRHTRVLLLGIHRDHAHGPWARALPDLIRQPRVEVLRIAPLSIPEVTSYLVAQAGGGVDPGTAERVHAQSGGNPLYMRTLARVLDQQTHRTPREWTLRELLSASTELRHLVAAQLDALPRRARILVDAASVIGTEIDPALLADVCETSTAHVLTGLEEAAAAGVLVRPAPDDLRGWRFVHDLVRDGGYAGLNAADRSRWHERAATALERRADASPERAGEVAGHWLQVAADAPTLRRAARWARAAARLANGALAFERAADLLAGALAATERAGADDLDRAELLVDLATAEYRSGRVTQSLGHCADAARLAVRAGQADLLAAAALVVQDVGYAPIATVIERLCRQALDATDEHPPATRARLLAQHACALAELDQREQAVSRSAEAVAVAAAAAEPHAEFDTIRARMFFLSTPGDMPERLRLGARAIELAETLPHPLAGLWGPLWRLDTALWLGDMPAAEVEAGRVAEIAEGTGLPLARWHHLRLRATLAALAGDFEDARTYSAEATALAAQLQDPSAQALGCAFALALAVTRGDASELPADFLDVMAAAPPLHIVRTSRMTALLLMGRRDEARVRYEQLRELTDRPAIDGRWLGAVSMIAEAAIAFGDTETVARSYHLLLPYLQGIDGGGSGAVFSAGSAARLLGDLAMQSGRTDDAIRHHRHALAANRRMGARPFVALTRLGLAEVLLTVGERTEAAALAKQAIAEARRLDMPGPLQRASRLLARIEKATKAADPLTEREREVADLLAEAMTNRDIADRLVLSERTVESHVRNILAKLGFTSRTQVTAWALRPRD